MRNGVVEQDPDPAYSTSKAGDVNKIACRRALKVAWIRVYQSHLQSRIKSHGCFRLDIGEGGMV